MLVSTCSCHLSLCPEPGDQHSLGCDMLLLGVPGFVILTSLVSLISSHDSCNSGRHNDLFCYQQTAAILPPFLLLTSCCFGVSLHHPASGYSTPLTPNVSRQTCSSRKALFFLPDKTQSCRKHKAEWGTCCSLFVTAEPAFTFELFQAKLQGGFLLAALLPGAITIWLS